MTNDGNDYAKREISTGSMWKLVYSVSAERTVYHGTVVKGNTRDTPRVIVQFFVVSTS